MFVQITSKRNFLAILLSAIKKISKTLLYFSGSWKNSEAELLEKAKKHEFNFLRKIKILKLGVHKWARVTATNDL